MGFKMSKIELCGSNIIKPNEEKELVVVLESENRSAIHGVVKFQNGAPVPNAIVKLFLRKENSCDLVPLTFTFTDDCGQFLFGVESGKCYVIKIFFFTPETPTPPTPPTPPCHHKDDNNYNW